MNDWKCTVKTPSNWLQTVYVQAYTYSDAVAFAEAQTGGKCINAVPQSQSSNSHANNDNNSESSMDPGFIFLVLIAVFLIAAWKYILIILGIALLVWAIMKWCQSMDDLN
jgi:hypothetical protein